VVAGALFDGLDLVGLARALGTHRLDVKARARRVLSRLAGEGATGSGLAAVRHMMAGEYALGLVPPDAFAPFQRGLALDPGLQALVAGWDARFAPFWQSVHVGAVPEPVHAGPPPAPVRTAPPPAVAVAHPAGGARRRLAAALAAVAVLGVGTAAWFGRSDAPRSAIVRPETLPTPTRAVAVTGEAFTPVAAAAAAATAGRAAPAAAAPPALPATASAGTAGAAVIPATRASAGAAREVTATVTVHLYHRADDPAVVDRAADLAAALRELGATVEVLDAGDLVVSADRLRFFLPEDAPAARLLVEEVAGVELQDFTHYVPQPRPGILELWMASGEAPA
jgi:hypothetical protein